MLKMTMDNYTSPQQPIIHTLFLVFLEIFVASVVILIFPIYWYLILGPEHRINWYNLVDYAANVNNDRIIWQIEVTRWSLWGLHIVLQIILNRKIDHIVPRIIANLSKWSYQNTLDPFKSVTLRRTTELLATCSKHLFNFLTSLSLYIITRHLFYREEKDRTWQYFLERTVLMGVVGMGAILLEKVLLHLLAIEFHRSLYQDRIYKSIYCQWIISTIKQHIITGDVIKTAKLSTWTRKSFPYRNSPDLITDFLLKNKASAEKKSGRDRFVKEIFKLFNLDPATDSIELKHLETIFSDEDARKVLTIFSNVNNNSNAISIDRENLKKSIQVIHQDRWDLTRALTTHASILKKLDKVMLGFLFAVILYFSPIMGYELESSNVFNFGVTLAPLIFSFIELFGDSIKRICEAIIYIVTCHPYDVGDLVTIDGVDFFAQKIGLVSTTFKRFDGFMVWIPNYVLARKALCNVRRTGMQGQRLEIQLDASVSVEKIQTLSASIKEFIKNDANDFEAVTASFFDLQQDLNRIVLVFLLKHRFNFQDGVQRFERHNRFLLFLKEEVTKLGIDYRPPVLRALLESDDQIKSHLRNLRDNPTVSPNSDPFTGL